MSWQRYVKRGWAEQFVALNLYRESVHRSALPDVVLVQRVKTFCFLFVVPVTASLIVTLAATSPLVQQVTIANPTIADFERLLPHNPVCPCQQPTFGSQYINLTWHPATYLETNICGPILSAGQLQVTFPLWADATFTI
jgi:hypothetical protein